MTWLTPPPPVNPAPISEADVDRATRRLQVLVTVEDLFACWKTT